MSLPTMSGSGRLIEDPDLKYSASGTAVCRLRLAFNSRKKDGNGEWQDADSFFVTGTLFAQAAENAAEALTRGTEVVVTGRLRTESWENRDGEKRSAVALLIDSVGPSLRNATAKVTKSARSGAPADGRPAGDPWASDGAGDNSQPPF